MKTCSKCAIAQPMDCFAKDKSKKDGRHTVCKTCRKHYLKAYYEVDGRREYKNNQARIRHHENKEVLNKISISRYYRDIEQRRLARKDKYWSNPEKAKLDSKLYHYHRMATDPLYKLKARYRKRVWEAYRSNGYTKRSKTFDLLGCSHDVFVKHIASQFTEGMTWENYGQWHVDHIIPFASAKNEEDVARLCHYLNLQPLWASDNLQKGAKLDYRKN